MLYCTLWMFDGGGGGGVLVGWLVWFFQTGFLCVALAGLKLRHPPASRMLGLKACTTTPGFFFFFWGVGWGS